MCILYFNKEEVGIGGVELLGDGEHGEGIHHAGALLENEACPLVNLIGVVEHFECFLLGKEVDVVGIFHLGHDINNLLGGECHTKTQGGTAPCLAHSVEHDDVGMLCQFMTERTLRREVAICLVDDDYAVEAVDDLADLIAVEGIARGVVG